MCVVLGCGWGYIVEALLAAPADRSPAAAALQPSRLIFFEPLTSVYECLRDSGRLSELEALGAIITPDTKILRERAAAGTGACSLLPLPAYQRLFPDLDQIVRAALGAQAPGAGADRRGGDSPEAAGVDRATGGRFLRQWTRNAILRIGAQANANFGERSGTPASQAEDALRFEFLAPSTTTGETLATQDERAVLFCGAGPRLLLDLGLAPVGADSTTEYDPHELSARVRELRRRFFIVAADTALAPLLAAGVAPDLAISVDSGPGTYYHLNAARAILLARGAGHSDRFDFPVLSNLAGPRCLPAFFERCVYYRSSMPLDQWLAEGPLATIPELANPARNAVGLALHIARLLGTARVRTAGADFQSAGRLTHVRGTGYSDFARERIRRTYSLEMYQPGGYVRRDGSQGRTQKNEISYSNARRMAAEFSIELKAMEPGAGVSGGSADGLHDGDRPANQIAATGAPRTLPPAGLRAVSARDMGRFLRDTRAQLNAGVFDAWNLPLVELDRWLGLLA